MKSIISSGCIAFAALAGFYCGYQYPRDVEIESTKPVVFSYQVTPEAARIMVLKGVEGLGK